MKLPNDGYGCGYGGLDNLGSFVEEAAKKGFKTGLWTEQDLDKLDKEVQSGTQMIKTDVAWVGEGYSFGLNAVRQAFDHHHELLLHMCNNMALTQFSFLNTYD